MFACLSENTYVSDGNNYLNKEVHFHNPILPSGADPWVIYNDGHYFYMQTMGNKIELWETIDLTRLNEGKHKVIWYPPNSTLYSKDIWAPEIHYIDGRWYVYFAADDGNNNLHRIYVLENISPDPMEGKWQLLGKVSDSSDKWAIDPTVFVYNQTKYLIWSGWEDDKNGEQDIYIAKMKNPWTIEGKRVRISSPVYSWERHGTLADNNSPYVYVNEGPEILMHKGKIFLVYSASGCWTDHYCLGMLELVDPDHILDSASWKKYPYPVLTTSIYHHVYAPGHCSFFKSPDQTEDWIVYHANSQPGAGCGKARSPRMQRFSWFSDGTPDFGEPVSTDSLLPLPSGTK